MRVGFLVGIGSANINFAWVAALLIGGAIAAPVAAWRRTIAESTATEI